MRMKRTLTTLVVTTAMLLAGLVAVPAAQAAVRRPAPRTCINAWQMRHLVRGLTEQRTFALLHGSGRVLNAYARGFVRCEYKATVIIVFNRPVKRRNARILRVVQVVPPRPRINYTQISTPAEKSVDCTAMLSHWIDQKRVTHWVFNPRLWRWVAVWGPWTTFRTFTEPATTDATARPNMAGECPDVVTAPPPTALLPDLRIKSLDKCGAGDLAQTNGTCFLITHADGRTLLKFPVITMNVGAAPADLVAERSTVTQGTWAARQIVPLADGTSVSLVRPDTTFTFFGAHDHWHMPLDSYWIQSLDGTVRRDGNAHGFCLQDNTTYTPFQGQPGIPANPFYALHTSCGYGLPNALALSEGLSRGWGDTYETALPEQAIDITGLADGTYLVGATANATNTFAESDTTNNTATMQITISGNGTVVTTNPATATGGL